MLWVLLFWVMIASRIPTQGSKGNGDSGRLVPRTRAGEQALQP